MRSFYIHIVRPNRGSSFFTMLIFVMMLVSTALMYYYFQRTRYLERELAELRNENPSVKVDRSSLFGFLPWGDDKGEEADSVTNGATPRSTPAVAVSTPEPQVDLGTDVLQADSEMPEPEVSSGVAQSTGALELSDDVLPPDTLTPAQERAAGRDEEAGEESAADSEAGAESDSDGSRRADNDDSGEQDSEDEDGERERTAPIESLYDQEPPRVRVRSPRRD